MVVEAIFLFIMVNDYFSETTASFRNDDSPALIYFFVFSDDYIICYKNRSTFEIGKMDELYRLQYEILG